jgi:hypothetical protein
VDIRNKHVLFQFRLMGVLQAQDRLLSRSMPEESLERCLADVGPDD